ncbi:MAG TPA: ABC transporter permease subunit [Nocardioidaceae bacterium]|nr:ABC transporter permease subunit [Nocardioidaceae bacterium]
MSTVEAPPDVEPSVPEAEPTRAEQPPFWRRHWRLLSIIGVIVIWRIGLAIFRGDDTLSLGGAELNDFQEWLNDVRDDFDAQRDTNWFLNNFIGGISDALNWIIDHAQELLSEPAFPRPVPEIGWLGVVAILVWVAYLLAGLRMAVLTTLSLLAVGYLGYWEDSVDTLIMTVLAVVICALIGLPLGIWMGRSKWATAIATPVLDLMQTMPAFAYLVPLALVFGIGAPAAVAVTVTFALPPVARITAHGLRTVAPATVEASRSLGSTSGQLLRQVQLPMAKRTILVGLNQTTMAALSMVTIAAFVDGPGLGEPVLQELQALDVGGAFVAGICIVILAIMLDRITTAAGERSEVAARSAADPRIRRYILLGLLVPVGIAVYLSRTYSRFAAFPEGSDLGGKIADRVNTISDWSIDHFSSLTESLKDFVAFNMLNPMEGLSATTPWWLAAAALLALGFLIGGWRALVSTAVCELIILGTGLWNESMKTLTTVLAAALLTMVIGIIVGIWMGRSRGVDTALRPILDALQTMPPFVYLIPALALFETGRFTAIVAAVAFAVPVAIKLVADGIRGVSASTVEAAESAGSNTWQMITKVQLPMSRGSIMLAANQGLLFVLSMVVIGGLVGGQGLGYLVVRGFSQQEIFGKGLAAAVAITALGVMLDRITRYAAERTERGATT